MLVKFDHLTYVVNRSQVADAIAKFTKAGYTLSISEDNAINSPTKMQFLKFKDPTHGLYFLTAPEEGGISVELIAYEHTSQDPYFIDYNPGDNHLTMYASDIQEAKKLMLAMGCDDADGKVVFNGALELRPYDILFVGKEGLSHNLDNEGFCCPTIFVRPAHKTKDAIEAAGFTSTGYEEFTVQGKFMYVFFAYDKNGDLIEFVSNKI